MRLNLKSKNKGLKTAFKKKIFRYKNKNLISFIDSIDYMKRMIKEFQLVKAKMYLSISVVNVITCCDILYIFFSYETT